jgi:hypothetical protein
MRREARAKSTAAGTKSTRLTPKSAKDVKVIRISSMAYNAVYVFAQRNNMTMTDAVSFMVGLAWKQLYKTSINAPGIAGKTLLEELDIAINKAVLKALGPDAGRGTA